MSVTRSRMLAGRAVAPIGLGTARLSIGDGADDDAAERTIGTALDLGIEHVDTALAYTTPTHPAHSEATIARVLARRPDMPFVATKGGHDRAGAAWRIDGRPATLRAHCERSLRTLGVEALDLYYLHHVDPATPFEESVGALEELRRAGLVRAVGVSNVGAEQVRAAAALTPLAAVQNPCSPYGLDRDALATCEELGVAVVGYSPLGGSRRPVPLPELSPAATAYARDAGEPLETVLLAWLLTQSPVLHVLTGATRRESLASSVRAAELDLPPGLLARIGAEAAARARTGRALRAARA